MIIAFFIVIVLFMKFVDHSSADIHRFVTPDGTIIFTNLPNEKGGQIVHREKKSTVTKKSSKAGSLNNTFNRESFMPLVTKKAVEYNLDPELIKAVIKAESNWNPYAVSPKGARGLMQLMPSTAFELGVTNSFDPEENIDGGARYLRYLLEKFNGDLNLAIAAYNAGPSRVEKTKSVPAIPETMEFVRRVMSIYTGMPYFYSISTNSFVPNRKEITQIKRIELEDGTILYTNSKILF
ncbi:MAG: lytic transglycosylase domain-containing protein [Thermodesulfovibrionales bacterium]|nr:lytic transglycosylase domain-containing protein [Thermodesulfovibrionales bacterium]